jgi:hypothetical protein
VDVKVGITKSQNPINYRAKLPSKKNKKNFSKSVAKSKLIAYFCVVRIGQRNCYLTTETLKLAQQTSKAVPIIKREKRKKIFHYPLDKRK